MNISAKLILGVGMLFATATLSAQDAPLRRSVDARATALTLEARSVQAAPKTDFYRPMPRRRSVVDGALTRALNPVAPMGAPARTEAADMPDIKGVLMYSDEWAGTGFARGLYTVPTSPEQQFLRIWSGENFMYTTYSGVLLDGILYTHEYEDYYGYLGFYYVKGFDFETGEEVYSYEGVDWSTIASGVAKDPITGNVYGLFYNGDGDRMGLATVKYTSPSPEINVIKWLEGSYITMAISPEGQIYAVRVDMDGSSVTGSTLCKIDKTDGTVTEVGSTGEAPVYPCGATFDPASGRMFWAVSDDSATPGKLVELNTQTGAATTVNVFTYGEEVNSLVIEKKVNPLAPGAPSEFTLDKLDGSYEVNFIITAPTTANDGTPRSGSLRMVLDRNGEYDSQMLTEYGGTLNFSMTETEDGPMTYGIVFWDGELCSERYTASTYIGHSTPADPQIYLSGEEKSDGLSLRLTYDFPEAGADGGYIDPSLLTYDVFRMPAHEPVLTGTTRTVFMETVPVPTVRTEYQYAVGVHYRDYYKEYQSNVLGWGTHGTPYANSFDNAESVSEFTFIDGNNDNSTWEPTSGALRIKYNSSKALDDWAVLPALYMEAGKNYRITIDAKNTSGYTERFEIKYGTAPTAAALTETAIAATDVTSSDYIQYKGVVSPAATGKCYIGIHAISDADTYYLWVDNVSVEAGTSAIGPEAVTNLTAKTDPSGALNAVLNFTAPTKDMNGGDLTAIEKVEIKRGQTLVHTIENPAVGAELTYTDPVPREDDYSYTVTAFANGCSGMAASTTVYVGFTYPVSPATVTAVETENNGEVTVSWDAVTVDENGTVLPSSGLTYGVYIFYGTSRKLVVDGVTDTSVTATVVEPGDQRLMQFAVFARNSKGEGEGQLSNYVMVGTPYTDFNESFPNGLVTYDMGIRRINGAPQWGVMTDADGVSAFDGDNGYIGMQATSVGDEGAIYTGKISLEGLENPGLSFATFNLTSSDGSQSRNQITVKVGKPGQEGLEEVYSGQVNLIATNAMEWGKAQIDLSEYAGQVIYLDIACTCYNMAYTLLDEIKVFDRHVRDMEVTAVEVPKTVNPGSSFDVLVRFVNNGIEDASSWTLDLYCNDEKVATKEGFTVAAGYGANNTFPQYMHELAEEDAQYHAVITIEGDEVPENNSCEKATVRTVLSPYPAITDLRGELVAEGVRLNWTAPTVDGIIPTETTEDLESAEGFADTLEGWLLVDRAQSPRGAFQNASIPGHEIGQVFGFFVFETGAAYPQFNASFAAASGDKYLASLFRLDGEATDDWAISPELSGEAQTVGLQARSYGSGYPEKIQLLYSTGSTDPADFVLVKTVDQVPDAWTEITADLPEGAKRFAFRSCAADAFMLMVDDITYTPAPATAGIELTQYMIYRDGEYVGGALADAATEPNFVDDNAPEGTHSYRAIAVWNKGISRGSNTVTVEVSGIDGINAGIVTVTAGKGIITIAGADAQATVSAADGRLWYSGATPATVAVPAGVYVVALPGKTVKVVVR